MFLAKPQIVCPSGRPDGREIVIDLVETHRVESRIIELQTMTKEKAPELLTEFIIAWKDLDQVIAGLTKNLSDAKRWSDRVRGRLILEDIPKELEKRGLITSRSPSGSADQREAMLSQFEEYDQIQERVAEIEYVINMLKGKLDAFDMVYNAIKKVITDIPNGMYQTAGRY